jgi:macrolide transport system ATP-binding/permease protein
MLRVLMSRIAGLFTSGRADHEFDEEIEAHLAMLTEDNVRRGMTPEEARTAARRHFGGVTQVKEEQRERRGLAWIEVLAADVRYALRTMRKNPGFTAVVVVTLALGIGVNTMLFTAYNAVALKPLPVANPREVVRVGRGFEHPMMGDIRYAFSYPEYLYCREHNTVFSSLVATSWPLRVLADDSGKMYGHVVSHDYFAGLGVAAQIGRTFEPADRAAIVISYLFWQRRFERDPQVLGRVLHLNGAAVTIIGVAPEKFGGAALLDRIPDFWAPIAMQAQLVPGHDWLNEPGDPHLQLLGRLKAASTLDGAQAQVSVLVRQFAGTFTEKEKTVSIALEPAVLLGGTDDIRFKAVVAGLMMTVGLVLLVACVNLANMLLARGAARQREMGIRLALGAGRRRVIRQLLTESVLLSLAGGVAAVVFSAWSSRLLWVAVRNLMNGPFAEAAGAVLPIDLSPDIRVLAYALGLAMVTGIVFGLSPALRSTRPDLVRSLQEEGSLGTGWTQSRFRRFLIAAQVGASMLLLITAGLLLRGLARSQSADTGFETRSVYMLLADFGPDRPKAMAAQRRLAERLKTLPEVQGVAMGGFPLMGTWTPPIVTDRASGRTLASRATETYLDVLGIPVLHGRNFSRQEVTNGAPAAVVSESAARRFWPGQDPVGRRFQLDMDFRGTMAQFETIGIAKDVRFANLTRIDPAHVYLTPTAAEFEGMLVRIQGDPKRALPAIRSTVDAVDRNLLPGLSLQSLEAGPMAVHKFSARMYATFAMILALLALGLAGVGIYGVMSYLVSQRIREIGIRMALGAGAGGVLRDVVIEGLRPVFVGTALGIAAAAGMSALLHATLVFPGSTDLLYGVAFYDPVTFIGLACFLTAIAAIASAVPARRALRVDPMVALRYE